MINKFKSAVLFGLCFSLISIPTIASADQGNFKIASAPIGNIQRDSVIVRIATGQAEKKSPNGLGQMLRCGN